LWVFSLVDGVGDGQRFSEALAINNRRWVVGRSTVTGPTERAFLWRAGQGMTELGSLGLNYSRALDVNNRGQVVGYASTFAGFPTFGAAAAFVWEDGVLHDLNDLIPDGTGWELLAAEAINASGTITGYGRLNGETRSFLLTPAGR
jgi:probable HAF family extracellular repeat protein